MTTYSLIQYDVLNDLIYFKGVPTPGLVDLINENKNDISSIRDIIQNDTIGQLNLLPSGSAQSIKDFLITVPEINLADSKDIILNLKIIDDTEVENVDIVSVNLDGTKTYVTKSGPLIIVNWTPFILYPTMGKCRNCLKFTFDEDNEFNFTGNIGGSWDGTFKNNQKVYSVSIPTFPINTSPAVYTDYKIFWKPNITYTGSFDYNGNPINLVNQKRWICVPSASIGTASELSNTTFFHTLNHLSASCPYANPTTTWYNFFGKDGYFLLDNTALPTLQTSTQNAPCPTFVPNPGITDWGYNCGPNGCVATPSGTTGSYATLEQCELSCSIDYGYNCVDGICVTGSALNPGVFTTQLDCLNNPCTPSYGYNCTLTGCVPGTFDNPGQYASQVICEENCPTNYGYNCVDGICVDGSALNPGSFTTLLDCLNNPCTSSFGYNCTPNGCVQGTSTNPGLFVTLEECELVCSEFPEPSYCECSGVNLVTNGDFLNGSANWNYAPTTFIPGVGIAQIDPTPGFDFFTAGTNTILNNDNTSSVYLSQTNILNISCSYEVCFQAWTSVWPVVNNNATIIIDDGNYPLNPTNNSINNLTQTPTAYTITLNNVNTNNLTFYFGFPSSPSYNAEINIDNICVTLLSCPPLEFEDCVISSSIDVYETGSYDCLCPEGYVSDNMGNCLQSGSLVINAISAITSSLNASPLSSVPVWGYSLLQNPAPYSLSGWNILKASGLLQPILYYDWNFNGTGDSSINNTSSFSGNSLVYNTQYTFDILSSSFWYEPNLPDNLAGPGITNIGALPIRWVASLLRNTQMGNFYYSNVGSSVYFNSENRWVGMGTTLNVPSPKTYYVGIIGQGAMQIKLDGTTILRTSPTSTQSYAISINAVGTLNFPTYYQNLYSRFGEYPSGSLQFGILPPPFYSLNNYLSNDLKGACVDHIFQTPGIECAPYSIMLLDKLSSVYNLYIYPVTMSAGCHKINFEVNSHGSFKYCNNQQGSLGAVIFDMTDTQIISASNYNDLNILWDSTYLDAIDYNGNFNGSNVPRYMYSYDISLTPTASYYTSICPSGSTPIGGDPCNGCLTTQSFNLSIPCGQCIECTHGRLYNGYVVDKGGYQFQGRGPSGIINTGSMNASTWVIPAESDWDTLITYTNGGVAPLTITGSLGTTAGGELKDYTRDLNATCWENPNIGAQTPTGSSGWAGTAGGKRDNTGTFSGLGFEGIWWSANSSSTFPNPFQLYTRELKHFSDDVYRNLYTKNYGFSLRLVRPAVAGEVDGTTIVGAYTGKDGTIYNGIVIGTQVWIDKNLSETQYNNGSAISLTTNSTTWTNAINTPTTASSCFYNNDLNNALIPTGNTNPLTGECYTFPSYYVYQKCGTNEYLVQNISGSTITPGEVQKDSNQDCWEFTNIATGLPNYPSQTIYTGNYFTGSNYVYNDCDECNAIHTIYMKFGTKNC